jgi:hypothetical protein
MGDAAVSKVFFPPNFSCPNFEDRFRVYVSDIDFSRDLQLRVDTRWITDNGYPMDG